MAVVISTSIAWLVTSLMPALLKAALWFELRLELGLEWAKKGVGESIPKRK